jgi:predicted DNA-binding transcriptional regulator AlpA
MQSDSEVPQLLRFKDLQRLGVTASWAGLRNLQDQQNFPPGKLLGPSTRVWTAAEVNAWLASRPSEPSEQTKARAAKSVAARGVCVETDRRAFSAPSRPTDSSEQTKARAAKTVAARRVVVS